MEKAIHITNLKNLRYFRENQYQRIYWGVEFCQNLIPTLSDTQEVLRFARKNSLGFTFVTPFAAEAGLGKLKQLFHWFRKKKESPEVVVNDWGILEYLHSEFEDYFKLTLGRLLVRQQRDPAMKKVVEKQLPFPVKCKDGKIRIIVHSPPGKRYREGMKDSCINSALLGDFLAKLGIQRVELNNLIQGLNFKDCRFKLSLYTPYVYISTSRFCPMGSKRQKVYRINVCHRECQKYYDILRNKAIGKLIYKRGNTTFYKNPVDIKKAKTEEIERVVFQPEIPF